MPFSATLGVGFGKYEMPGSTKKRVESGSVVSLQRSKEVHGGKECPPLSVEKGEGWHVTDSCQCRHCSRRNGEKEQMALIWEDKDYWYKVMQAWDRAFWENILRWWCHIMVKKTDLGIDRPWFDSMVCHLLDSCAWSIYLSYLSLFFSSGKQKQSKNNHLYNTSYIIYVYVLYI